MLEDPVLEEKSKTCCRKQTVIQHGNTFSINGSYKPAFDGANHN